MTKIAIFREKRFEKNNFANIDLNKSLTPFYELVKINWKDNTISVDQLVHRKDKDDFVIVCLLTLSLSTLIDYIKLLFTYHKNKKYFVTLEPIVVAPLCWNRLFHLFFDNIFTRNDRLIDKRKYKKLIWPQAFFWVQEAISFKEKKLITLMNANKWSPFSHELYSAREEFIRYCENNKKDFDLYGWWRDKPNLKQKVLWFTPFSSYKWRVDDKLATLSTYKFNVCFENMSDTPWYITEKIRDSFKAKTVPIYRWASNITEYVPENCFIDYRKYIWNNDALFLYLETMDEDTYATYIQNIEQFLESSKAKQWFDKQRAHNFLKCL